jgi:type I restriction enzyme S subunit
MTALARQAIPLPPLAEQVRIRQKMDETSSLARALESTLVRTGLRCRRLRQAILKWAFEGKLVDQDPSDEPASALLERIRAERDAMKADERQSGRVGRRKRIA